VSGYIEEIGGSINAWTWKEMTFYHARVPANQKERAVRVVSEQLRASTFPEEKIKVEMSNIVQELRRRNDNPQQFASRLADEFLYGSHPLGKDTLGTEASLGSFTRQDFLDFKARFYTPANYAFIIAGNVTPREARTLFETHFPEQTSKKRNERVATPLPPSDKKELVRQRKDLEQIHVFLVAPLSKASHPDHKASDLFNTMISGGMSFPLFQEVRDKRGLCYEIWASSMGWFDVGEFNLYIGTDPARVQEAIGASLEVIRTSKTNEPLLQKAKRLELGQLALRYENTDAIINIAAQDIALTGAPKGYNELVRETERVKLDDIIRVANTYLLPERIKTVKLAPET
jgi:predicted Zn-dependent peptidase